MPSPGAFVFRFQRSGYQYALTDRLQLMSGRLVYFGDTEHTLQFLRPLLHDPAALDRLRRRLLLEGDGGEPREDHELLREVAERVVRGKLVLWKLQPVLSARAEKVLDRFEQRLTHEMQVTPRDLLDPNLQTIEGHPLLKQIPPETVLDALKDLFNDLPLGDSDIGRELIGVLENTPAGRGRDLARLSPRELVGDLRDQAKDWIKDKLEQTRADHPALFWSMAAAALVGAGALTYSQGTDLLKKLGVDPEIKHSFFDGMLTARGSLEFAPELQDPKLTLDARGRFADGKLELGAGTTLAGEDFGDLRPQEYHVDGTVRHGASTLRGEAHLDGDGDLQRYDVEGSHTWRNVGPVDQLTASGGYERNFQTDSERITGGVSGTADQYNFSVRGSHDVRSGASSVMGDFGKDFGRGRISGFVEQEWGGPHGSDTRAGVLFTIRF